ncbi:uncharacterized protein ACB058_006658 [Synchiropus picturatus]
MPAAERMFAHSLSNMTRVVLSTLLLAMVTTGQYNGTTSTPDVTESSSAAATGSWKGSLITGVHRPCDESNKDFCWNNGICVLPQDSNVPSCICPPNLTGQRCVYAVGLLTIHNSSLEKLIALFVVMVLIIIVLSIFIYCVARRRLQKSAPKPQLPETAV